MDRLRKAGLLGERRFERSVDMRYGEQAYDLAVSVDEEPQAKRVDMERLRRAVPSRARAQLQFS